MQDQTIPLGVCGCGCGESTTVVSGTPRRFVRGHNYRGVPRKATPRWLLEDRGYETPCWIWQRALDHEGYPRDGTAHAHRKTYAQHRGQIPAGLQLHHLCEVPACVNPDHLLPVTPAEHARLGGQSAKTHCPQGHPYDEANTYRYPNTGHRRCRTCHRERVAAAARRG